MGSEYRQDPPKHPVKNVPPPSDAVSPELLERSCCSRYCPCRETGAGNPRGCIGDLDSYRC